MRKNEPPGKSSESEPLGKSSENESISEALVGPVESTSEPLTVFEARPDLKEEAQEFAGRAAAENTTRAKKSDWKVFSTWCDAAGVSRLPASPENAAAFLTEQARTKSTATILRYAQTIAWAHREAGLVSPLENEGVKRVLAGIRNVKGVRSVQKRP